MLFNAFIAAAILATSTLAAPAPQMEANPAQGEAVPAPSTSEVPTVNAGAPAPPAGAPPAVPEAVKVPTPKLADDTVQKLLTVAAAADRFTILDKNDHFKFDFNAESLKKGTPGGELAPANRKAFPALVGTGSGMAVGFLEGCGFNTPHVHPRATELQIVVEGSVITEMLPENGVLINPTDPKSGRRVIRTELTKFQMTPFYQGSVHTQYNPNCEPATFIASFNNEDFGTGQVLDETFSFDKDIVAAAFGQKIKGEDVDQFKNVIPISIANGVKACLEKCKPKQNN